ncbi:30S ribosomal protein S31, chloroplastic [Arachis duranensis]|uniref:30S ribosomal protein S31, chloroplastic n=1 Tax=Arachis duranensis TaxID=130453 RepID=A0A6P4CG34_ARADU|nr:30S ribosomal protein S31, chloroplastic [Arachis duranensis]
MVLSSAMASLLLASPPPFSTQLHTSSSSHLSFSHSQTLSPSPLSTSSLSVSHSAATSSSPSPIPYVYCGRGDKKTAKGKRFNHSFGNARPRDKKKGRGPPRLFSPPAPTKKDRFEDNEVVKIEIDESLFTS